MHRDANVRALELTLVEKAQARRQKGDNCRRCVLWPRKLSRRARLVMVFEKARELVLIIEAGQQVVVDWSYRARLQPIIEPLVVTIVEALLL